LLTEDKGEKSDVENNAFSKSFRGVDINLNFNK
jgi:hypothetical protein